MGMTQRGMIAWQDEETKRRADSRAGTLMIKQNSIAAPRPQAALPSIVRSISRQPQLPGNPFHRLNAECDVLFQINAQICSAVDNVIAVHAAGEGFVLHFFADGLGFHFSQ